MRKIVLSFATMLLLSNVAFCNNVAADELFTSDANIEQFKLEHPTLFKIMLDTHVLMFREPIDFKNQHRINELMQSELYGFFVGLGYQTPTIQTTIMTIATISLSPNDVKDIEKVESIFNMPIFPKLLTFAYEHPFESLELQKRLLKEFSYKNYKENDVIGLVDDFLMHYNTVN